MKPLPREIEIRTNRGLGLHDADGELHYKYFGYLFTCPLCGALCGVAPFYTPPYCRITPDSCDHLAPPGVLERLFTDPGGREYWREAVDGNGNFYAPIAMVFPSLDVIQGAGIEESSRFKRGLGI